MSSLVEQVESENVAHKMLILSTTLSGLMVLEYAWNVRFETRVIWPQFFKRAEATIFVISRYVGIVGQIFNVWFVNRMASGIAQHPLVCRAFYLFCSVIVQCLLMSVEVLLMLRVRQMSNNNNYVFGILAALVVVQCAGMIFTARTVLPKSNTSPTCIIVAPYADMFYIGASTVAAHLSLLAMILWKYFRGNWPERLHPYLKITVRDSTCAVAAVTGTFLPLTFTRFGYKRSQIFVNAVLQVIFFSFWLAAGRLVLDKERSLEELQNDSELTEVDLDNLEPLEDAPHVCPAKLPGAKSMPAKASSTVIDLEAGTGDVTDSDGRHDPQVDKTPPSNHATTVVSVETGDGNEGPGSGGK